MRDRQASLYYAHPGAYEPRLILYVRPEHEGAEGHPRRNLPKMKAIVIHPTQDNVEARIPLNVDAKLVEENVKELVGGR